MRNIPLWFCVILFSFCVGCGSPAKRAAKARDKAVSGGVHTIRRAISAGRIDVANEVAGELGKIIPEPKGLRPIQPLKDASSRKIYVLPADSAFTPQHLALQVGTPEFLAAVTLNPANADAERGVESVLAVVKGNVADAQTATLKAAQAEKRSGLFGWVTGLGIGSVLGLGVLCLFFPALIPVAFQILRWVLAMINRALSALGEFWREKN